MIITHKLECDFLRDRVLGVTEVMQNDSNSHELEIALSVGSDAWQAPDGVTAAVAFRKHDGTKGLYEKLPNGDPATSINGSTVTAILAPQVLTAAGPAQVAVVLFDAQKNRLATFPVKMNVIPDPSGGGQVSNDYFNPSLEELHADVVRLKNQLDSAIKELNDALESGELDGEDGLTPYIGLNGNWWVGETDTGVQAHGEKGEDGKDGNDGTSVTITHIIENTQQGNWVYFSDGNILKIQNGKDGEAGPRGANGVDGIDGYAIFISVSNAVESQTTMHTSGLLYQDKTPQVGDGILCANGNLFVINAVDGTAMTISFVGSLKGAQGQAGADGRDGNGIAAVRMNSDYTLDLELDDGTVFTTPSLRGATGETGPQGPAGVNGNGIKSIWTNDDYTISFELADGVVYTTYSLRGETGPKGEKGIQGEKGDKGDKGDTGPAGADYVLTDADKEEIAGMVDVSGSGVGQSTTGKEYTVDGQTVVAEYGAEIFNSYVDDEDFPTIYPANEASGYYSSAAGIGTKAHGYAARADGQYTKALGDLSYAGGGGTIAKGMASRATGGNTVAKGYCSSAEGENTIATGRDQHVQGKFNVEDTENKYAHIVGNGEDDDNRSNAHTVDWDGNGWFAGKIKMGGTSQDDENAVEVATKPDLEKLSEEIANLTLGIHTDGLLYLFVNSKPVGTGIDLTATGNIVGYIDENNTIVLKGDLAEGVYSVKYEMEDGSTADIGNLVLDNNVYHTITWNLTNCTYTSIHDGDTIADGESYTANITADAGCELSSVVVTMGDMDITASAFDGTNAISIGGVTGDVVITAVAEAVVLENVLETVGYIAGTRIRSSTGEEQAYAGIEATGYIPIAYGQTISIKNITLQNSGHNSVAIYDANKTFISGGYMAAFMLGASADDSTATVNGEAVSQTLTADHWQTSNGTLTADTPVAFIRFSANEITDNSIVYVTDN